MIPYSRQCINPDDVDAVVDVLRSDWLTQGPMVEKFEGKVGGYCGARNAVAVCNATAALHLACRAFDLGPGDSLWTSPNTFVASANCARYCGADVDFVDIDPRTYNMSVAALAEKLEGAKKAGRLPKIVMPVHFAGQSCEMKAIRKLSDRYGFGVIEDASHAVSGRYEGRPVGSCQYSDVAVLSFHPVKIITTGEGGMLLTNRPEFLEKFRMLRSHGITRDVPPEGPWYYEQTDLGYNYRITDIQAALGVSQMKRIDEFARQRLNLVTKYNDALEGLPLQLPWQATDCESSWHLYVVRLQLDRLKKGRKQIFEDLRSAGIWAQVHYIPVHLHPYYRKRFGFKDGDFPEAELYYQEAISLPLFPELKEDEQAFVISTLKDVLR